MSRKEVLRLLEMLYAAYPNTRIASPCLTANVWEEALKHYDAKEIYLCAKYHIENNKFFPSPSEIINIIPRVLMICSSDLEKNEHENDCEVDEFLANYLRLAEANGEADDEDDSDIDTDEDLFSDNNE